MSNTQRIVFLILAALLASAVSLASIWLVGGSVSPLWVVVVLIVAGAVYGATQTATRLRGVSDNHVLTVGLATVILMPVVLWLGLIVFRNSDWGILFLFSVGWLVGGGTILEYGMSAIST